MSRTRRIPLRFPLPASNWVRNPQTGLWYSIPWTKKTRAAAELGRFRVVDEETYQRWLDGRM